LDDRIRVEFQLRQEIFDLKETTNQKIVQSLTMSESLSALQTEIDDLIHKKDELMKVSSCLRKANFFTLI
jgi:hypothetical protein